MLKKATLLMIGLLYLLALCGCDDKLSTPVKPVVKKPKLSKLAQIKHDGVLHVLTRTASTTYYPVTNGHAGLEYDLASLFAKQLGVKVEFHLAKNFSEILHKTEYAEIDIAAAGLAVTESRSEKIRFTEPYHEIVEQVIYRTGTPRPKTAMDLSNGILEVVKDSSYVESLQTLQKKVVPQLSWLSNAELDSSGLIALLNQGLIDYTITDSTQALLIQRFYPQLHIGFAIGRPRQIAWGLPKSADNSLYDEINHFFKKIKQDKTLEQLLERYYGHANSFDYADRCKFYQHQKSRLPLYKPNFIVAAQQQNLDWRLLAAIGYQESHWEDGAVSPTGVKGIMMLTNGTALQVGIEDRTDPAQSIKGGAIYFQQQLKKISKEIAEPDRTWFALAAYNVGYAHLEDARSLAKQQGLNPDKWLDVKAVLPLLAQEPWFSQTKHGYARGEEPVMYVENVRNYYDLLLWLNTEKAAVEKKNHPPVKEQIQQLFQKVSVFFANAKKTVVAKFISSSSVLYNPAHARQ